jgi:hypothetical protein
MFGPASRRVSYLVFTSKDFLSEEGSGSGSEDGSGSEEGSGSE